MTSKGRLSFPIHSMVIDLPPRKILLQYIGFGWIYNMNMNPSSSIIWIIHILGWLFPYTVIIPNTFGVRSTFTRRSPRCFHQKPWDGTVLSNRRRQAAVTQYRNSMGGSSVSSHVSHLPEACLGQAAKNMIFLGDKTMASAPSPSHLWYFFVGAINEIIQSHGWFMIWFYPH